MGFYREWNMIERGGVGARDSLEEDMKKAIHHKSVYLCHR